MTTIKIDTCIVDWSHNFSNNYNNMFTVVKYVMFELSLLNMTFIKAYTIVFTLR